jgi:hypothetical protein
MSRHKSPERIQRDIEKAIRKERRERKRQEREERRRLRIEKRRVREHVAKNGIAGAQLNESSFGFWDAIHYDALTICESCCRVVYESRMMNDVCEQCFYSKEVIHDEQGLKTENAVAEGTDEVKATAECLESPSPAQLKLDLS